MGSWGRDGSGVLIPVDFKVFEGLTPQQIADQFSPEQVQEAISLTEKQPSTQLISKIAPKPFDSGYREGSGLDHSFQGARRVALSERADTERQLSLHEAELGRKQARDKVLETEADLDRVDDRANEQRLIEERERKALLEERKFDLSEGSSNRDRDRLALETERVEQAATRLGIDQSRFGIDQERLELHTREVDLKAEKSRREIKRSLAEEEKDAITRIIAIQPSVKTSDQVVSSYLKVKSLTRDLLSEDSKTRGAGIVTLINIFNKGFVDENAAVRKEDIDNMRNAQSALQSMAARMKQFETGEAFSDALVEAIDNTVEEMYDAYGQAMVHSVEDRLKSLGLPEDGATRAREFILAPLYGNPSISEIVRLQSEFSDE